MKPAVEIMKRKIILDSKLKFHMMSAVLVSLMFWFSFASGTLKVVAGVLAVLTSMFGVLTLQYSIISSSSMKKLIYKTALSVVTIPAAITLGTLLSLYYFPNLSIYVKTAAILVVGGLLYISLLVNNTFLVVHERGEIIPLFRVASTWSQILVIVVSIPLFAGIYKLPFLPFFQTALILFTASLFSLFLNWVHNMDPDIPAISDKNRIIESIFVGFTLGALSISTSFLPTESFLRALLMSSVLMFILGYMLAHHKNAVTRKLMVEYSLISILFLGLVLIFNQI
jgi:hypothetical protein